MTETGALRGAGSAGRGPERADTIERAGAGSGSGRRARIATWKGRVQMRRWTGRAREPQPGGCGREGVAAASGALRTSRSEPGAGRGRGRALTVRSGAPRSSRCHRPRPRRAQPPQQQAAPPRPPRSILTPTRAPQPRATAPPPKMASPAPRPPHNAARRDVIHPPPRGGAQGKLRRGSTVLRSPEASGPRVVVSGSEVLSVPPQGTEKGEGCQAARTHPPRLAPDHSPRPPAWPEGQACQLRLLLGLAQPPGTPAAGLTQQPAGGHAESVARPSLPVPAWEPSRCQQTSPERPGGITKG